MKRKIKYYDGKKQIEREFVYIPFRFILAIILAILNTLLVIAAVVAICYFWPYFYIVTMLFQALCVLRIVNSTDNPDYKAPWIIIVLVIPIAGFMIYLMFYSRRLSRKFVKKIKHLIEQDINVDDAGALEELKALSPSAYAAASLLKLQSYTNVYKNTELEYYEIGEKMHEAMLEDLKKAKSFIFMEYFIIEEGVFWNSILEILVAKVKEGVEVRVMYDDIGCMTKLSGLYYRKLKKLGINAIPFSMLTGNANNKFNNRNHRKIMIIDGKVAFTGGINIADEYINRTSKLGHWKDTGIRLEGNAVNGLTKLFIFDFEMNSNGEKASIKNHYFTDSETSAPGFVVPYDDGPVPVYSHNVSKSLFLNIFYSAQKYVYLTTPYLIIDNELCSAIENCALRGVDFRIITPSKPDKKIIYNMTRSYYTRLIKAGVQIFEYEPGFIHEKSLVCDDNIALVSTVNLDYRSLVHHFENGVFMYGTSVIPAMKADLENTLSKCKKVDSKNAKYNKVLKSLLQLFAPLL